MHSRLQFVRAWFHNVLCTKMSVQFCEAMVQCKYESQENTVQSLTDNQDWHLLITQCKYEEFFPVVESSRWPSLYPSVWSSTPVNVTRDWSEETCMIIIISTYQTHTNERLIEEENGGFIERGIDLPTHRVYPQYACSIRVPLSYLNLPIIKQVIFPCD